MTADTLRIRAANDAFRRTFGRIGAGRIMMTRGIGALPADTQARIFHQVATFSDFGPANDPHGEHDFGSFEEGGHRIFWKLDYFDREYSLHSPDPADPAVTRRVLTIMLASEY